MEDRFRFGEFEFDAGSQELRRVDGSEILRLAPQPAQLLHLLASRGGAIVSRDEIRQRIWPDTHVDFDASLHFCVRQVRTALGDSGSEPRYVQNLPRRGYRLVPAVMPAGRVATGPRRYGTAWVVASLVLLVAGGAVWYYGTPGTAPRPPVRIAIMPFESAIAERVLEHLAASAGDAVALVGPTTTSAYAGSDPALRRLAADYRIDYVLNVRSLGGRGRPSVLAELIRVSDGAHVWVRPYDDLSDGLRVGRDISEHVARVLELAP